MEFKQFTYLILSVALLALLPLTGPNKLARLRESLKYMIPGILFTVAIYIIWGTRFNQIGVYSFNPEYTTGITLWDLPMENWIFLFVVSFISLQVYSWVKIRFAAFEKPNVFLAVSLVLAVIFGIITFFYRQRLYSFFTFFLLTVYFGYTIFRNRFKKHYTKFYITYFIVIIPVLVIKGILTSLPVITYNNSVTLGVRIFSIPMEDLGYFFLLLLMNISIFEYINERRLF